MAKDFVEFGILIDIIPVIRNPTIKATNGGNMPFSSYLGKPTLRLDPFSKPASYNTYKGFNGVTSTLWVAPSKAFNKWLLDC